MPILGAVLLVLLFLGGSGLVLFRVIRAWRDPDRFDGDRVFARYPSPDPIRERAYARGELPVAIGFFWLGLSVTGMVLIDDVRQPLWLIVPILLGCVALPVGWGIQWIIAHYGRPRFLIPPHSRDDLPLSQIGDTWDRLPPELEVHFDPEPPLPREPEPPKIFRRRSAATVVLERSRSGWRDLVRAYAVEIDGERRGWIRRGQTREFPVMPGEHVIRMRIRTGSFTSPARSFTAGTGDRIMFRCAPGTGDPQHAFRNPGNYLRLERDD
ncbi:hypothetical protein D5S17_25110 [Pseudonocardiaceae bacterium YIM PH 21723]|nr:hypothetical protein D5S17_25110 [Pseudonocardiaceae bacterium YIM PH 21723]